MVWNEPGRPHDALAAPGVRLSPGEALVEVELATICPSDVRTVRGERPAHASARARARAGGPGRRRRRGRPSRPTASPLELGDRVVWSVAVGCGECDRCTRGLAAAVPVAREVRARTRAPRLGAVGRLRHPRAAACRHRHRARRRGHARAGWSRRPRAPRRPRSRRSTRHPPGSSSTARLVLVTGAGLIGLTVAALAIEAGADGDRLGTGCRAAGIRARDRRRAGRPGGAVGVARAARHALAAFGRARTARRCSSPSRRRARPRPCAPRSDPSASAASAVLVGSVAPGSEVCLDPESLVRRLVTVTAVHDYTGVAAAAGGRVPRALVATGAVRRARRRDASARRTRRRRSPRRRRAGTCASASRRGDAPPELAGRRATWGRDVAPGSGQHWVMISTGARARPPRRGPRVASGVGRPVPARPADERRGRGRGRRLHGQRDDDRGAALPDRHDPRVQRHDRVGARLGRARRRRVAAARGPAARAAARRRSGRCTRLDDAFEVEVELGGERMRFEHPDVAEAYGLALLELIGRSR